MLFFCWYHVRQVAIWYFDKKKIKKRRLLLVLLGEWEESGPFGRQLQAPPMDKHSRQRCLWKRLAKIFTVDRHVSGVEVRWTFFFSYFLSFLISKIQKCLLIYSSFFWFYFFIFFQFSPSSLGFIWYNNYGINTICLDNYDINLKWRENQFIS